jgi:hypothetical protein
MGIMGSLRQLLPVRRFLPLSGAFRDRPRLGNPPAGGRLSITLDMALTQINVDRRFAADDADAKRVDRRSRVSGCGGSDLPHGGRLLMCVMDLAPGKEALQREP